MLEGRGPLGETRWAQGAGLITAETPARLEAFLRQHGRPSLVLALNSQGGDLDAALAMGRAIRAARLITTVGFHAYPAEGGDAARFHAARALCHGACAIAYLGGARRALDRRAALGFHHRGLAFPDGGARLPEAPGPADGARTRRALAAYLEEMIIDERLIPLLEALPANAETLLPSHEDLRRLRIAEVLEVLSSGEPAAGGWLISRRPDTPSLSRAARLVDRPHRPITVELVIGCHENGGFVWALDVLLADAIESDDARLASLAIRLGTERLTRPQGESEAWQPLGDFGFAWLHSTPRARLAAAAAATRFTVELSGEDGWAGRAELSDGLAGPLAELGRACDAYNARPPAPGR